MSTLLSENEIMFRKPEPDDAGQMYQLVKSSPPLDLNSEYYYYLLTHHYSNTCIVAEQQGQIVGFISAYFIPNDPDKLFIWQVAVDKKLRGQRLGSMMLGSLIARPECCYASHISTTVNPSNTASMALFESYSESIDSEVVTSEFIHEDDFTDDDHEAEVMLTIDLYPGRFEEKRYAYI